MSGDEQHQEFAVGDTVRVKVANPGGHNRAPRYVRGRCGRVERYVGSFGLPDDIAVPGRPVRTADLFTVRFPATELWGPDGNPSDCVHLDLYSLYLEQP
jgi:hypothetical protein